MTPAAIRVVDVPGTGAALLGNLRQVDALLACSTAGRAPRPDGGGELRLELLVADRDHVERRLERVRSRRSRATRSCGRRSSSSSGCSPTSRRAARSPTTASELPPELEPLTTKPLVAVENGPGGIDLRARGGARRAPRRGGGGVPRRRAVGARRDRRRAERGARPDHVLHRRRQGDARVDAPQRRDRARRGRDDPHRHRPRLHPLRGDPLGRPGRAAARAPRSRSAGCSGSRARTYVVEDGDVLNIRFNV